MEKQLSETIAIICLWVAREIIGSLTTNKKLKKIVEKNSKYIEDNVKHIEENKALLVRIKNRIK